MIRFAKAIMVTGHSIACVLLAGYVYAPVIRFGHAALGLWVWVWGSSDAALEGG
ncbi:hypothetical protein N8524_11785 [Candidatus Puniceispirillum sp.]|nr:hypothetical protein [Candidatus Puniceispirillum sp.]